MNTLIAQSIHMSTLVRAELERVYDAMTSAAGLDGWFTHGAAVDARPGGSIRFRWQDWGAEHVNAEDGGPVLEADRPRRFVFQWNPDNHDYVTTVVMDFLAVQEGTLIRLEESGYHDTPSGHTAMLECAAGWGEALTLLKMYVEHGVRY